MKKENYLYDAFKSLAILEGTTPTRWALDHGLSSGTPTALKKGVSPQEDTLRKLFSAANWNNKPEIPLALLVAHLKDIIVNHGFNLDDIEPVLKSEQISPPLDNDLQTIAAFMTKAPIRESIKGLAALLRVSDWANDPEQNKREIEAATAGQHFLSGKMPRKRTVKEAKAE